MTDVRHVGVLLCVAVAAGGCARTSVPMPPDDADATTVARAFARALTVQDCETADRLFTARGTLRSGCGLDEEVTVTGPAEPDVGSPVDRGLPAGSTVVVVPVVRRMAAGGFLGIGSTTTTSPWSYVLMRGHAGEPWRVVDQGLG